MTWADLYAALGTLLTGAGYTVATVTDAAELPTHTAGLAVIVAADIESEAIDRLSRFDALPVRLTAICVHATSMAAASASALTLGLALRELVEDDTVTVPGASARAIHVGTDVVRLGGANAVAVTVRFTAYQTG